MEFINPRVTGSLAVSGNIIVNGGVVLGDLTGTASFTTVAVTASYIDQSVTTFTASLAYTSSISFTSSISYTASYVATASTSQTSSYLSGSSATVEFLEVFGTASIRNLVVVYETSSFVNVTGSTKFGDELSDQHQFTGSVNISGSFGVFGSASFNNVRVSGSVSASQFSGSGANLFDISASAINGLNLSRIATGSATASAVMTNGTSSFQVSTNTIITGSLFVSGGTITGVVSGSITTAETASFVKQLSQDVIITGSLIVSGGTYSGSGANLYDISASSIVGLNLSRIATGSVTASADAMTGFTVKSEKSGSAFSGSVNITGSLVVSGAFTVVGADGSSLRVDVPSDPTTGSMFTVLDPDNSPIFEVFANKTARISGSLTVTGGTTGSFTGSFNGVFEGTASYAANAAAMDGGIY